MIAGLSPTPPKQPTILTVQVYYHLGYHVNGRNNEIALSTVLAVSHAQETLNKYTEASIKQRIQ